MSTVYVLDACALIAFLRDESGWLKASYKVSLADSIALAQAVAVNGELMTADHHEFDVLEGKEPVRFYWVR